MLINSVLHRRNATTEEIDAMKSFCSEAKVDVLSYAFLEPIGRAYAYYENMAPTPAQFEFIAHKYPQLVAHEDGSTGTADAPQVATEEGGSIHGCAPGMTDITINVDGQLGPCTYYRISSLFKDVRAMTADEIVDAWRHSPAFVFARIKTTTYECKVQDRCRLFKAGLCMRCQAMSFEHFGDPYAPHPWCVMHYKELGFSDDPYMKDLNQKMAENYASGRLVSDKSEHATKPLISVSALEK